MEQLLQFFAVTAIVVLIGCESDNAATTFKEETAQQVHVRYEYGQSGHYIYAPSAIKLDDSQRAVFVCSNQNKYEIVDHIYLYRLTKEGDKYNGEA